MTDTGGEAASPLVPGWRVPVLLAICLVCVLPELVLTGADWGLWGAAGWRLTALQNAGFWAGLLYNWRPNYAAQPALMFLTYGFLHAGLIHLIVNMMTLFSLGPVLVERFGTRGFLGLYTASILGGAGGFALLSSQPQPMVGASGALFGLAGAHVALHYRARRAGGDTLRPVATAVLGLVGLNLVLWWAMSGQLAWETHLGGFVTGWVVALLLDGRGRAVDGAGSNP